MSTSIIILAAGKGTRLKSNKPKVFHEVGNLPIIFHVIETAKKLKPKEIVVVISQSMLQYKAQILNYDVKIKICIQDEQKGTGHAVKCCENLISQKTQNTLISLKQGKSRRPKKRFQTHGIQNALLSIVHIT